MSKIQATWMFHVEYEGARPNEHGGKGFKEIASWMRRFIRFAGQLSRAGDSAGLPESERKVSR